MTDRRTGGRRKREILRFVPQAKLIGVKVNDLERYHPIVLRKLTCVTIIVSINDRPIVYFSDIVTFFFV